MFCKAKLNPHRTEPAPGMPRKIYPAAGKVFDDILGEQRPGFTLIELLVVMGCIVLLIGLLLPALGAALEASRATACMSNTRQLANAAVNFAIDNDGGMIPFNGGVDTHKIDGVEKTVSRYWYGGNIPQLGRRPIYYEPAGMLYDALGGSMKVAECPSLDIPQDDPTPEYGKVGYAYSLAMGTLGPEGGGVMLSRIVKPSVKATFWDAANIEPQWSPRVTRTTIGRPTSGNPGSVRPNFHGRHNGKGHVAWVDGHASNFTPYCFDSYAGGSAVSASDAVLLKKEKIGNIDSDANRATDEHYDPDE